MKLYTEKYGLRHGFTRILFRVFLCSFLWMSGYTPSVALDDPEAKIAGVIENYVVATYPNWADLDINVTFKFSDRVFARLRGLGDEAAFRIVDVYKDFKPVGNVIFPIEVSDGGRIRKIFIRAKVEVLKKIVVAKNKVKRGAVIGKDDLDLEERDIAMLPQKYFTNQSEALNTEAKITIPRNSTLFKWMIKEIPLVHRGDDVSILVKGPNLLVKTPGVVLVDGYLGKEVKVKRKGVKGSLEGILISSTEVEVNLK